MQTKLIVILLFIVVFISCKDKDCSKNPDVANINVSLNLKRLDKEMFKLQSKEDIKKFLLQHPLFARKFLKINEYPHDSIVINEIYRLITDTHIDTLYQDVEKAYGDFADIESEFVNAFKHIKYYYPDFHIPEINTIVSGFGTDFYVSDSLIVIGLDMFLGPQAKFRPPDMPLYILKRYQRQYIVPSCVFIISDKYNRSDLKDDTMLKEMIAYGKAYYFTKSMLPCLPDSMIIGYTKEEMDGLEKNQEIVWKHFIKNNLFFEANHTIKNKYLGEGPKTLEIGDKAPGRIAGWLGWQIVKAYMEESDVTLPQLMENRNAQEIFTESKYKPKH